MNHSELIYSFVFLLFSFCFIYFILHRGSEDTALLFLKEIYRTMNINPEQPQH